MPRAIHRGLTTLAVAAAALLPLGAAQSGVFPGANGPIAYTCGTPASICKTNDNGTSGNSTVFLAGASDPSWSSDEFDFAYVNTGQGVWVRDTDLTDPGNLTPGNPTSAQPSFSFDGDRVAYSRGSPAEIYSSFSDTTGGEVNLTNNAADDVDPAYSPDGTKIAFASNRAGTYDIWVLNLSTSLLTQVTTVTPGNERHPTWSPSGGTIVYESANQLFAVNPAGGVSPQNLNVPNGAKEPTYSPDGTKIAFIDSLGHLVSIPAAVTSSPFVTTIDSSGTFDDPDWQAVEAPTTGGAGAPTNIAYPGITLASGDSGPVVGHFLFANVGTWNGAFPISYKYQWKRCDAADPVNGPCVDIVGATSSFFTPTATDSGKRLRVQVTATNGEGSNAQNSEVTAPVIALAPVLRDTPQIAGDPRVDETLSLFGARWDGSIPITFTYSWRRCNPVGDPPTCVQIPGATEATYTQQVADIGFSIRVWITGTNTAGSDVAITNHTAPVLDKEHFAPSASTSPAIVGTPLPARQLTANIGDYSGDAPVKTSFVWQRCDATGAACRTIPNAKKVVYFPRLADIGFTLRLAVTATNAYGNLVTQSDPTEPISATPPHVKGKRIVGTAKSEYLAGGGHDDEILGNGGNDTILGGAGADRIDGGAGNDIITGGSGADRLLGGNGSDTIRADDGERDIVDCGAGQDRAIVDSVDKVTNCEVTEIAGSGSSSSGSGSSGGSGDSGNGGGDGGP